MNHSQKYFVYFTHLKLVKLGGLNEFSFANKKKIFLGNYNNLNWIFIFIQ